MKKFLLTIFIILVLVFLFFFWGGTLFTEMSINSKISELRDSINFNSTKTFTHSELENQPELVQKYIKSVVADSINIPKFVISKQEGKLKTDVNSEWKDLTAVEYFTTEKPNFLWKSKMSTSKFFWVNAIDSYISGKGNMLIKLNSSVTIADSWGLELDKSGLFRYLSEAVLFPTTLIPSENLLWDVIDTNIAEVKFNHSDLSVVAKLYFDDDLRLERMETYDKYRALEVGFERSLYTIYYSNYKNFGGKFFVPTQIDAEWELKDGKFKYAEFMITSIEYE